MDAPVVESSPPKQQLPAGFLDSNVPELNTPALKPTSLHDAVLVDLDDSPSLAATKKKSKSESSGDINVSSPSSPPTNLPPNIRAPVPLAPLNIAAINGERAPSPSLHSAPIHLPSDKEAHAFAPVRVPIGAVRHFDKSRSNDATSPTNIKSPIRGVVSPTAQFAPIQPHPVAAQIIQATMQVIPEKIHPSLPVSKQPSVVKVSADAPMSKQPSGQSTHTSPHGAPVSALNISIPAKGVFMYRASADWTKLANKKTTTGVTPTPGLPANAGAIQTVTAPPSQTAAAQNKSFGKRFAAFFGGGKNPPPKDQTRQSMSQDEAAPKPPPRRLANEKVQAQSGADGSEAKKDGPGTPPKASHRHHGAKLSSPQSRHRRQPSDHSKKAQSAFTVIAKLPSANAPGTELASGSSTDLDRPKYPIVDFSFLKMTLAECDNIKNGCDQLFLSSAANLTQLATRYNDLQQKEVSEFKTRRTIRRRFVDLSRELKNKETELHLAVASEEFEKAAALEAEIADISNHLDNEQANLNEVDHDTLLQVLASKSELAEQQTQAHKDILAKTRDLIKAQLRHHIAAQRAHGEHNAEVLAQFAAEQDRITKQREALATDVSKLDQARQQLQASMGESTSALLLEKNLLVMISFFMSVCSLFVQ